MAPRTQPSRSKKNTAEVSLPSTAPKPPAPRPAPRPRNQMAAPPTTNADKDALAQEYEEIFDQANTCKEAVIAAGTGKAQLKPCKELDTSLVRLYTSHSPTNHLV